jgi:hypothetical protein
MRKKSYLKLKFRKFQRTLLIKTYNTGAIAPSTVWKLYETSFVMPVGEDTVVLQMINNNSGGNGNDFFIDDIQFRPCGASLSASATPTSACAGSPFTLAASASAAYASPVYQWQRSTDNGVTWNDITGATALSFSRTETVAGTYLYRMLAANTGNIGNAKCHVVSNPVPVVINALPTISGANSVLIGNTITLTGSSNPSASNAWVSSNLSVATVSSAGVVTGVSTGTTTITYTNSNGCKTTLIITVPPYCYKHAVTSGNILPTNHGITSLGRAGAKDKDNWPMVRNSAHTVLESKTKGFVITRIIDPETAISAPVEGMMVFDADANGGEGCLKIYSDGVWSFFTTAACP